MKNASIVLTSVFLISCTSAPSVSVPPAQSPAATEVVQIDLADASGPEVICTKVTRPGTRIVVGETCSARNEAGINVQTREEIQREISGQGWASGWKTREQIEAERRIAVGGR